MDERCITPMGKRMIQQEGKDGSTNMVIKITEQEHSRIENDALQIRETFLENNPTIQCMSKDEVYYFLLGVYCNESSQGEYEKIVNERIAYSRRTHQRALYRAYT